jgi:hypothetical protein
MTCWRRAYAGPRPGRRPSGTPVSWEAYCAAELPELRHLKLRAPERRARIQTLRNAAPGISVRELAAATGAAVGTVHADLAPRPGAESVPGAAVSNGSARAGRARRRPADVFTMAKQDPAAPGAGVPRPVPARRGRPDRLHPASPPRRHRHLCERDRVTDERAASAPGELADLVLLNVPASEGRR